MCPALLTKTLAAASVNAIAQSQSLGAAGNVTLNGATASGGLATLDTQRRVLITSAGNDSGISFTVFGATDSGTAIQETLTGANAGAVATNQDFATVTKVSDWGATASTVQIGTNTVGSTRWLLLDQHVTPGSTSLGALITAGSATYTAEYTYDDFLTLLYGGRLPDPADGGGADELDDEHRRAARFSGDGRAAHCQFRCRRGHFDRDPSGHPAMRTRLLWRAAAAALLCALAAVPAAAQVPGTQGTSPPYFEVFFDTPGTYSQIVPANLYRLYVDACSGGGAGSSANEQPPLVVALAPLRRVSSAIRCLSRRAKR